MNTPVSARRLALLGTTFTLFASTVWSAPPAPAAPSGTVTAQSSPSSRVAAAEARVVDAQAELDRTLAGQKFGVAGIEDVAQTVIALANARIAVAMLTGKTGDIPADLETVAAQQQILLKHAQVRYRAGVSTNAEMDQAQSDVSVALARVQLYEIVTIKARLLEAAERSVRVGVATTQDRDIAADALRRAQLQFDEVGH